MLKQAREQQWIKGFKVGSDAVNQVTIHLLYADDTLIFCEAEESQARYLNLTLYLKLYHDYMSMSWKASYILSIMCQT